MAQQDVQNGGGAGKGDTEVSITAMKLQLFVEAPKAAEAVQFYKTAFGAVETGRTTQPKRKADQELPHVISARLQLAGSTILISDLADNSAQVKGVGTGISLCLETEDVEGAVAKAVAAGAVGDGEIVKGEGGSVGQVKDPYGFVWVISSPAKEASGELEA